MLYFVLLMSDFTEHGAYLRKQWGVGVVAYCVVASGNEAFGGYLLVETLFNLVAGGVVATAGAGDAGLPVGVHDNCYVYAVV